jgi:DNA-directed RNA polymerase beta' subunit
MALDEVDFTETNAIDVNEVCAVLGIEAARKTIIAEIIKTIKAHSLNVDKRHLILLADILTSKGKDLYFIYIIFTYSK